MSDKQEEMLIKLAKYFGIDPDEIHRNEAISSALLQRIDALHKARISKKRAGGISVDYRKRSGGLFNRMGKK
tara:strand:+ start:634 stop:849 length:216 start_codon:yes stop_codon:yes gene_type:complete